ncbi:hypothetical protein Tco_0132573 [Tanacetum coccineum]
MDNTGIFGNAYDDEDVEEEDHPEDQFIGKFKDSVQDKTYDQDKLQDRVLPNDCKECFLYWKDSVEVPQVMVYETLSTLLAGTMVFTEVKKKSGGIFISQDKYVAEILKKFDFASLKTTSTLIETNKALVKDEEAEDVDVYLYRSMIGSLMYLTASRPDILFAVCACLELVSYHALGARSLIDSPFDLEAFFDSDYAGASLDRKSTTDNHIEVSGKSKEVKTQRYLSLVVPLKKVGDEVVHKELGDRMERAATTASSLEAEQDSGSSPRCQDTILGDVDAQTRFEITSKQFNDPPLLKVNTFRSGEDKGENDRIYIGDGNVCWIKIGVNTAWHQLNTVSIKLVLLEETAIMPHDSPLPGGHTPGSDKGRLKHDELMELVTKLSDRVVNVEEDLKHIKKTYSTALTKLVLKVKKLEKQVRSGKARRRARIILSEDKDAAEDPSKQGGRYPRLIHILLFIWYRMKELHGEKEISTADVPVSTAGAEVSTTIHDVSTAAATLVYIRRSASKDKGKAIMQELEPPKKLKKRVQVQMSVDKELARKV